MQRNQTIAIPTIERPPPVLPEARPAGQTVTSDVLVPALQNLVGGLGAGVFVERVLYIAGALPQSDVWFWSCSTGLLVFGLATAVRAFRDEIVIMIHAWAERRNRQDYTELLQERDALQAQVLTLNDEIQRLRQNDSGTADGRIHELAMSLLWNYYQSGEKFTWAAVNERNQAGPVKISRAVWDVITDFFRAAKVIDGNGGVKVDNFQEAWAEFLKVHMNCTSRRMVSKRLIKALPPAK